MIGLCVLVVSAACGPGSLAQPSPGVTPTDFTQSDVQGGVASESSVVSVQVAQHDGFDRFVIEFGAGVPIYTVTRQTSATFVRSPRGDQVTIEGSAGVLIVIHSITNWTDYTGPTAFHPRYARVREALQVENFEGYQQWALGIQGTPALRVSTLTAPDRLVVDIAVA